MVTIVLGSALRAAVVVGTTTVGVVGGAAARGAGGRPVRGWYYSSTCCVVLVLVLVLVLLLYHARTPGCALWHAPPARGPLRTSTTCLVGSSSYCTVQPLPRPPVATTSEGEHQPGLRLVVRLLT